ncbi:hypothetical protein BDZ97DRAFT_1915316 [Flammula alnicola]|nr:hypothetical protein BDZ97DRAFT_1915316 [Flammula alnicola]
MPAIPPEKPAARGRNVASKPLNGSSSASKSKSTASASGSTSRKPPRPPSASSTLSSRSSAAGSTSAKAAKTPSASRTPSRGPESGGGFKVTKLSSTTVTLPTTWAPRPPASEPAPPPATAPTVAEQPPTRTSDPLQVAAQVYPWTYMSSTLDACFKGAETIAINDLETRARQLTEEESEIADERDRLEAERAIDFFEELGSDTFAKDAPAIMQLFHSHGDSCARVETEALKLAMRSTPDAASEEPLKVYNDMLHDLEELQNEATSLQNSITKLTEGSSSTTETATDGADGASSSAADASAARSQVTGVFASCLPVLRARIANLSMAQELIDTTLENVSLTLRMESMGLA